MFFMRGNMETKQEKLQSEIWDILFLLVIFVTVLAVNFFRIRELLQLTFIAVSVLHVRFIPDMVYGFIVSRILFLLWAALSFLWAFYSLVVLDYLVSVIQSTALAMSMVIYLTSSEKRMIRSFKVYIATCLLLILYLLSNVSFFQILNADFSQNERITAGNINANQVGVCCSYAVLIVYGFLKIYNSIFKWMLIGVFTFFSLITGSKKALITLVLGLFLLILMKSKDIFQCIIRIVMAVVLLVLLIWLLFHVHFLYETMGHRVEGLIDYLVNGTGDKSTYSRSVMIIQAKKTFLKHPLLGIGLHNFKEINVYGVYAHNNYWELLVCLGIPGFLFYYIPLFLTSIRCFFGFLGHKDKFELTVVMMLCFLVNEYSTVSYTNEVIQIIVAMIISMVYLYGKQVKKYE